MKFTDGKVFPSPATALPRRPVPELPSVAEPFPRDGAGLPRQRGAQLINIVFDGVRQIQGSRPSHRPRLIPERVAFRHAGGHLGDVAHAAR